MPKSKKRKGAKSHQRKVDNRNSVIKNTKRKQEKYQQEQFDALIKQYEKEQEGKKVKTEVPDIDQIAGIDGPEI